MLVHSDEVFSVSQNNEFTGLMKKSILFVLDSKVDISFQFFISSTVYFVGSESEIHNIYSNKTRLWIWVIWQQCLAPSILWDKSTTGWEGFIVEDVFDKVNMNQNWKIITLFISSSMSMSIEFTWIKFLFRHCFGDNSKFLRCPGGYLGIRPFTQYTAVGYDLLLQLGLSSHQYIHHVNMNVTSTVFITDKQCTYLNHTKLKTKLQTEWTPKV